MSEPEVLAFFLPPDSQLPVLVLADGEERVLRLPHIPWCCTKMRWVKVSVHHHDENAIVHVSDLTLPGHERPTVLLAAEAIHIEERIPVPQEPILRPDTDTPSLRIAVTGGRAVVSVSACLVLLEDEVFASHLLQSRQLMHEPTDDRQVLLPFHGPDGVTKIVLTPDTQTCVHTDPCAWGSLRMVGLVMESIDTGDTVPLGKNLRIGGSPNLLQHEDLNVLADVAPPLGSPWRPRLHDEPILVFPNRASIDLTSTGGPCVVRLHALCSIIEEYAIQPGLNHHGAPRLSVPCGERLCHVHAGPTETVYETTLVATLRFTGHDAVPVLDAVLPEAWGLDAAVLADRLRALADLLTATKDR